MANLATERRTLLRFGFALGAASLSLVLTASVAELGTALFAGSSGIKWYDAHAQQIALGVRIAFEAVWIPGLVCLYLASSGVRWRRSAALLLALAGVGVACTVLQITGGDAAVLLFADCVGEALGWVALWLLAVLAAEAAEMIERPEITHQTEVVGRSVLWGGFVWLAWLIWSFPPSGTSESRTESQGLEFAAVLQLIAAIIQIFAVVRTAICCGGLTLAYSGASSQPPPGEPA